MTSKLQPNMPNPDQFKVYSVPACTQILSQHLIETVAENFRTTLLAYLLYKFTNIFIDRLHDCNIALQAPKQ